MLIRLLLFFLSYACHTLRFWGLGFFFNTSADNQNKKINLIKDLSIPIPDSGPTLVFQPCFRETKQNKTGKIKISDI